MTAIRAAAICFAMAVCADAAPSQNDTQAPTVGSVASCFNGDADSKIAGCTALLALGPGAQVNPAAAFNSRGTAYLAKRDYAHAVQDFDRAIRLQHDYVEALLGRCAARAYADKGFEHAVADCDAVLRLDPGNVDALGLRGLAQFKMGRYEGAIADCDQVLSQYPQSPFSLYLRGHAKRMSHDSAGGEADIAAAIALRPTEPQQFAAYGIGP